MFTYLWYDFETYGADPKRDRISRFAGIRTDENFNILEEYEYFCKLSDDYIPNPEACLITGITPLEANEKGISEEELSDKLYKIFTTPNTVGVGYNSFKFDDEILRHLFYRTFRNPYKREWSDGCSRWDFLRGILGFYFKNPESINFPKDSEGKISFKLEYLSVANNIIHENAHDALSDVRATIAMAKLLKEKDKYLYDYIFKKKKKNEVIKLLNRGKFFYHIDFSYGLINNYSSILYKIDYGFNKDEYIFLDLNSDLDLLYKEEVDELKKLAYMKKEELEFLGKTRPGIKTIKANSIPLLFPCNDLSNLSQAVSKAKYIETRLRDKLSKYCKFEKGVSSLDIEIDPYNNFFSYDDEAEFAKMRENPLDFKFQKENLQKIFVRFKAKNYFEKLSENEKKAWNLQCYKWLNGFEEREDYLTFDSFKEKVSELKIANSENLIKLDILNKLELYVLGLENKMNSIQVKTSGLRLFAVENKEGTKTKNPKIKKVKDNKKNDIEPLTLF